MASITSLGVGSGLDISSLVSQLVAAEGEATTVRLASQEADAQAKISALGSLKGALSTFATALAALDSPLDFQGRRAESANEDVFTASALPSAVEGTYAIEVESLAQSHKLTTAAGFTDADASVGSGSLTISVGSPSFTVTIDPAANSLDDIRQAINDAPKNTGVTASIINVDDGLGGTESRLVLSADGTGSDNALRVVVDDDDGTDADASGLSVLAYDPAPGSGAVQMTETQAATDALIKVDGLAATRSTNVVSDVIQGVTLDLQSALDDQTFTLSVELDRDGVSAAVGEFVSAFNSLNQTIGTLSVFDAETGAAGTLLGDATLRGVESAIRREMTGTVGGLTSTFDTLAAIGIRTGEDGGLSVDASDLNAAMDADFDGIGELFAGADGVAVRLDAVVSGFIESNGTIDTRTGGLADTIDRIDEQRAALSRRLDSVESRLLSQFIAMDTVVGQLQSTGNFLTEQLSILQSSITSRRGSG